MIAIIDYGMGNLRSVHNAFKFIAPQIESVVTSDPAIISKADRIVFPGRGQCQIAFESSKKEDLERLLKIQQRANHFWEFA